MDYCSGEDFAHVYDFDTPETLSILGGAVSDIVEMPLREIASTGFEPVPGRAKGKSHIAQTPNRPYHEWQDKTGKER